MNPQSLQIRLSWQDPVTGERREPLLNLPVALGREFAQMPAEIRGLRVSRIVLNTPGISRFHALIDLDASGLIVIDQNTVNGILVNGQRQTRCLLANGDLLQIADYHITVSFSAVPAPVASPIPATISFNPDTDLPESVIVAPAVSFGQTFPPNFFQSPQVNVQDLYASGNAVDEVNYTAVGAGLGSFFWVDLLRISGVETNQIVALGLEEKPYARYQRLCLNSQILPHERLRSNSDSCPDNIWGWPSYALREAWHYLTKGKVSNALGYLWQVFAEPTFTQTYTPRSGNVFASIDREAQRIGWEQIFRNGSVRAIRKTTDGRYAIAYSRRRSSTAPPDRAFLITQFVHLATGYPAIQFLPDLQAYRQQTNDFKSVVNAYEDHHHVYEYLENQGGTVLIRGRGIVASRIIQRIYEARQHNKYISILHLMRSPKPQGNKFASAQRQVENHYEFQPFNWPKACWGGDLREMLEKASPQERKALLKQWGGTTTADRKDWKRIVNQGIKEGWYQITFGEVEKVERDAHNRTVTYIQEQGLKGQIRLEADFIIDATGLDAQVIASPLLNDLVKQYNLPLLDNGRLAVANDFEIVEMRNQRGRIYASGAITLGNSYAAVDSFLGLQYAALCAVDSLATVKAPKLHKLNLITSFIQWLKWAINQSP
ncbi:FHA domain-containing protein [Phormidium sp. LEGE 05292]|uniref:FHA domain-containing protein n=1 Tax=[Phormidium] sp. LEGE 05292 TaxID=767427 RepID=UPI0018817B03|nr:FHA domain-containing protein [Phormidium sp. LEGE 05292]MBE9227288.1 FHA domain-containing protein [Phormidium sp. LEGE 05292]